MVISPRLHSAYGAVSGRAWLFQCCARAGAMSFYGCMQLAAGGHCLARTRTTRWHRRNSADSHTHTPTTAAPEAAQHETFPPRPWTPCVIRMKFADPMCTPPYTHLRCVRGCERFGFCLRWLRLWRGCVELDRWLRSTDARCFHGAARLAASRPWSW